MPTVGSVYDVAALLGSLEKERWPEVEAALVAGGAGHAVAPELDFGNPPEIPEIAHDFYQEAIQIAEQERMFRRVGANLHTNIAEALKRIRGAERCIADLKALGDIEFLEGNGEVEQFLRDATRNLNAAQALKHMGEKGEPK